MLLATSPTKKGLLQLINEYFYTNNCIITDDNKVFNTKLNRVLDGYKIIEVKNRFRFELEI